MLESEGRGGAMGGGGAIGGGGVMAGGGVPSWAGVGSSLGASGGGGSVTSASWAVATTPVKSVRTRLRSCSSIRVRRAVMA